jgi:hypothetical protein
MNDQQKQDSNGELTPTETMETKTTETAAPPKEVATALLEEQTQQTKASVSSILSNAH